MSARKRDGRRTATTRTGATHDGAALGLVCGSLLAGVLEDEVEEDVEAAEVARDLAVPLQVDKQELVHVLLASTSGKGEVESASSPRRGDGSYSVYSTARQGQSCPALAHTQA